MKVGTATSVALHAAVLGFALVTIGAPPPLEVPASESFPIDIVPIEEFAQSVAGDRRAEMRERPAPIPTERPREAEEGQNVGNNTADLATPPTPEARPRPVETAAAPPPPPEPVQRPEPQREPEPAPPPPQAAEPAPAPTPQPVEAAPEPAPAPQAEPQVAAAEPAPQQPVQQAFELPRTMPIPTERPRRQETQQTASIPQQQRPREQPRQQQTQQQTQPQQQPAQQQDQQLEAQIAALLNRDRPSGGGTQRSTEEASLGGRQTTGARLSQSEIDSLRSQVSRCWNPPVGAADADRLIVSIRIRLSRSGELEGNPEVVAGGGASMAERAAADAARRAVLRCQPYTAPSDKYEAWADVQFNFDPRDMF